MSVATFSSYVDATLSSDYNFQMQRYLKTEILESKRNEGTYDCNVPTGN